MLRTGLLLGHLYLNKLAEKEFGNDLLNIDLFWILSDGGDIYHIIWKHLETGQ